VVKKIYESVDSTQSAHTDLDELEVLEDPSLEVIAPEETASLMIFPEVTEPSVRTLSVYGEITEERVRSTLATLNYLKQSGKREETPETESDNEEASKIITYEPIEFLISTEGGNVQDMFSIYDCMRNIEKECEIHTFGIGKVMSAGTLILAAGTKGKRKVGRNCRLMMHSVRGGHFGSIKELEVDMKEVRWYQEQFIKAMAEETSLSYKQVKNIFRRKTDTYFDAEQALKWGLADEIV